MGAAAVYSVMRVHWQARVRSAINGSSVWQELPVRARLSSAARRRVRAKLFNSSNVCGTAVQVLALMSKDLTHMTRIECHKLRAKWTHILGVLRLNGAQSRQLVELRKSHLANLRVLYEDRQRLNMQARRTRCGGTSRPALRRFDRMRNACLFSMAQSAWLL